MCVAAHRSPEIQIVRSAKNTEIGQLFKFAVPAAPREPDRVYLFTREGIPESQRTAPVGNGFESLVAFPVAYIEDQGGIVFLLPDKTKMIRFAGRKGCLHTEPSGGQRRRRAEPYDLRKDLIIANGRVRVRYEHFKHLVLSHSQDRAALYKLIFFLIIPPYSGIINYKQFYVPLLKSEIQSIKLKTSLQ